MKNIAKHFFCFILIFTLSIPTLPAQEPEQGLADSNTVIEIDEKLERYHSVLLKRPESEKLFDKFQSSWLSNNDEKSLATFLKQKAEGDSPSASKMLYAKYLTQRGKDLQALDVLNSAITKDSSNETLALNRAKIYGRLLDFDKAIVDIDKAIKLKSEDPVFSLQANKLKGRYLTKQGMADEAITHWNDLAKQNPDDQELIEDVIDILVGDGLLEPALIHAIKLRDNTREPYRKALRSLRIADILQKQGNTDKATKIYDETLKISGTASWLEREILARLESLFRREENVTGLKTHLRQLYVTYPQRLQIAQNLAQVHVELDEYEEAKKVYYDLIKRSPTDVELKKSLLSTLEKAQDLKGAQQLLNSIIEQNPADPELHVQLAQIFFKLKNKESALQNLNEFVKKSDKKIFTTIRHATLLRSMNYDTEAAKVFDTAVAANPESTELLFKAAEFYIYTDKKEKAKAIWQTIAKSEKSDTITKLLETLLFNAERTHALKIVEEKLAKFKTQKSFLSVSVKIAESNKKQDLALQCATLSLQLADNPIEISAAINQVARLNVKFKTTADSLKKLRGKDALTDKDQFLLIALLEENGDLEQSDKLLAELANSKKIPSLLLAAKTYEKRYQQDKAAKSLEKIMSLPNGLKSSYLKQLTTLYQSAGNSTKALETVTRWKKLTPNDKAAWLMEVEIHEELGNTEEALKALRRGIGRFEEDQDILSRLAALYAANRNFPQSKQLYWRLYDDAKSVTDKQLWVSEIANISLQEGSMDELIDALSTRRRNSPKSIAPLMALATVYDKQGKKEERRNLMLIASKLRPDDADLLLDIANGYQREGDMSAYADLLAKAQTVDKTGRATRKLAKFYFDDNDYEKGMLELEKLSSLNNGKQNDQAKRLTDLEDLVMTLMRQEAFEEARNYLDTKIAEFSNHGRLLFLSAVIDYELGYIKRSFETTKQLIAGNMNMDNIQSGWQFSDFKQRQSNPYFKAKVSQAGKISQAAYSAISYLSVITPSAHSRNNYNYYNQSTRNTSPLPKNREEMQFFAKLYAARLMQDVSGEQKLRWTAELKAAGFTRIKFYELISDVQNRNEKKLTEYTESKIDDPFFLELAIDTHFQRLNLKLTEKLYKKIIENKDQLSPDYQALIPFCFTSEEQKKVIYEKLVTQLDKEKITPLQIAILVSVQNHSPIAANKPEPLPEKVTLILQKYIAQHSATDPQVVLNRLYSGKYQQITPEEYALVTADNLIKQNYFLNEDYVKIAGFLNDASNINTHYSYGPSSGHGFGYGRGQNQITIETAINTITTVTVAQRSMLTAQSYTGEANINIVKLFEQVDLIKNPILKCLIAMQAEPKADHSNLFKTAKESKKHLADALTLEAYHKRKTASNYQLATLINQAKKNSTDRAQRQSLDAILVNISYRKENSTSDTAEKKPFTSWEPELQNAAKSAARRLLLAKKITEAGQIKELLEKLDMQKEKSRFLTKNNKSIRASSSGASIGGIVGRQFNSTNTTTQKKNTNPTEKANVMFTQGQRENAVRLIASTLQKQLKDRNSAYQVKQTVEVINKHKAQEDVLARFSPKGSISPRKWLAFYLAADTLGAEEEKKQAISKLKNLEIVPQSVRLPLALALTEDNPERSIALLSSVTDSSALFQGLSQELQRKKSAAEDYNAVNKLDDSAITPYIKSLKFLNLFLEKSDAATLLKDQYSFSNLYNNQRRFLNDFESRWNKLDAKKIEKYKKELTTTFRQLDNFALTNKASSELALSYLYKDCKNEKEYQILENKLLEQLQKQASLVADSPFNGRTIYSSNSYGYNNQLDAITKVSFLVRRMLKKKNVDIISDEVLKKLEGVEREFVSHIRFAKEHALSDDKKLLAQVTKLKSEKDLKKFQQWDKLLTLRPSQKAELVFTKLLLNKMMTDAPKATPNANVNVWQQNQALEFINHRIRKSYKLLRNTGEDKLIKNYLNHLVKADLKSQDDKKKEESWLKLLSNHQTSSNLQYLALIKILIENPSTVILACESASEIEFPLYATDLLSINSYGSNDLKFDWDADRWIKELESAQILTNKDKIANIQLKSISVAEAKSLHATNSNLWNLSHYDPKREAKSVYDLVAHMIKGIRYYNNQPSNGQIEKDVITKLKAIKGDKRLSAQILLTSGGSVSFTDFCKNNKKEILSSSSKVKTSLVSLLDLNNNSSRIATLKSTGLYSKLPLDTKKLDAGRAKDKLAFSKLTAPLNSNELRSLDEQAVELIEKFIRTDAPSACKIIDHYIHLVKNSPEAKNHYSYENYLITPLEYALSENIIDNLRRNKVYPKHLLKLIYHLHQRKDSSELNITEMLYHSMPINWPFDRTIASDNTKASNIILNDAVKTLNSIKDPDYLQFCKTAWAVYFCADAYYQKLHFNNNAEKWSLNNEKLEKKGGAIEYLRLIIPIYTSEFNNLKSNSVTKAYLKSIRIHNFEYFRNNFNTVANYFASIPLKDRMLIVNAMGKQGGSLQRQELSQDLLNFIADTYIEVSDKLPEHAISSDFRQVAEIRKFYRRLSPERIEKIALAAAKNIELSIKSMQQGKVIHENHFNNLIAICAIHEKSMHIFKKLVKANQSRFSGSVVAVQALTKYGEVDLAYSILPPSVVMKTALSHPRIPHCENMDKYTPLLLDKYSKLTHKATVAALIVLSQDQIPGKSTTVSSSFIQRIGSILDLALNAEPDFPHSTAMKSVATIVLENASIEQTAKMKRYFEEKIKAYSAENLKKKSQHQKIVTRGEINEFRGAIRYAISTNKTKFLEQHLARSWKLKKVASKDGKKQIPEQFDTMYAWNTSNIIISSVHELFGNPENDKKIAKLLPVYRGSVRRRMNFGNSFPYNGGTISVCSYPNLLFKYIHDELGKAEASKELIGVMRKRAKQRTGSPRFYIPILFTLNEKYNGTSIVNERLADNMPILLRVINNRQYQIDVIHKQQIGGTFDALVDFNILKDHEALEFLNSGKIIIKEPAYAAILESDRASISARLENVEAVNKHYKSMLTIFKQNKIPKKIINRFKFYQFIHLNRSKQFKSADLLAKDIDNAMLFNYDKASFKQYKEFNDKRLKEKK